MYLSDYRLTKKERENIERWLGDALGPGYSFKGSSRALDPSAGHVFANWVNEALTARLVGDTYRAERADNEHVVLSERLLRAASTKPMETIRAVGALSISRTGDGAPVGPNHERSTRGIPPRARGASGHRTDRRHPNW